MAKSVQTNNGMLWRYWYWPETKYWYVQPLNEIGAGIGTPKNSCTEAGIIALLSSYSDLPPGVCLQKF